MKRIRTDLLLAVTLLSAIGIAFLVGITTAKAESIGDDFSPMFELRQYQAAEDLGVIPKGTATYGWNYGSVSTVGLDVEGMIGGSDAAAYSGYSTYGGYTCYGDSCQKYTCRSDTCQKYTCTSDTCQKYTCKSDTCQKYTCTSDTCQKYTCRSDTCQKYTCRSDTCQKYIS